MKKIPNDWIRKAPVGIVGFMMGFVAFSLGGTGLREAVTIPPTTLMMLVTMGLFKVKNLADNYYWWLGGMVAATVIGRLAM